MRTPARQRPAGLRERGGHRSVRAARTSLADNSGRVLHIHVNQHTDGSSSRKNPTCTPSWSPCYGSVWFPLAPSASISEVQCRVRNGIILQTGSRPPAATERRRQSFNHLRGDMESVWSNARPWDGVPWPASALHCHQHSKCSTVVCGCASDS